MGVLLGIDHIAITVADMEATHLFYDRLFGAEIRKDYAAGDRPLVRILAIGGGVTLSVHQAGNGLDLVARSPTPGSADLCFRWSGPVEAAIALLEEHHIQIVEGPAPRETADGMPGRSVYFRDPDGNLIELMTSD